MKEEAIVVVGMACRFAGCTNLDEYWALIRDGRTALRRADRWPDGEDSEHIGGFLSGQREFDARYFRISPNEARCMDPQQRLLLQSVQHAVDDSFLVIDDLRDLRCGVFVAALPGDYRSVMAQRTDLAFDTHSFLGNAPSALSGRISYFYDIDGPSLTLDTACSSSLSALHMAVSNLRDGSCRCAIVGAVSAFSTPEVFRFARRSNMSSELGVCLPFTEAADGFVPAEGVASIVLMRYDEAQERGLRVYGAVDAVGVNHNGTTNGLMAPFAHAQAKLIEHVYRHHHVETEEIAYVETHGTGTALGDPIELDGLRTSPLGRSGGSVFLGAVKPLIGHTLVCAGLAGVIKILLCFSRESIPPMTLAGEGISYLDIDPFVVNHDLLPWPEQKPLAAVSAFGFTGSNGHAVLRKLPRERQVAFSGTSRPRALPFCLSAQTEGSLREFADGCRALLDNLGDDRLHDMSQLLMRRPRYPLAKVIVAQDCLQLAAELRDLTTSVANGEAAWGAGASLLDEDVRALVGSWLSGDIATLRQTLHTPAELADIRLPEYPFERRCYWALDGTGSNTSGPVKLSAAESPAACAEPSSANSGVAGVGIVDQLCRDLSLLLGCSEQDGRIEPSSRIATLGLDSLSAVKLFGSYQKAGISVKAHELFRYETVADLAAAIDTRRPQRQSPPPSETSQPGDPLIRWREYGSGGLPVLLLPPLNSDERSWSQQMPTLLREGRSVYVPVYPGHAGSGFEQARFSIEQLADDVASFSADLPGASADVVGWSFGGCIAISAALRHPGRIRSLVLVSCSPRYQEDVFERTLDLHHELQARSGLLEVLLGGSGDVSKQLSANTPFQVLRHYYDALSSFDIVDRLREIDAPTLIVNGREDCVVDAEAVRLLSQIPGSVVREFQRHGHYAPLTAGKAFNEMLVEFLADRPGAGS